MILAFDLATKTGWCLVSSQGAILSSGVLDLSREDNEHYGHMFMRLYGFMEKISGGNQRLMLAYEMAHHRAGPSTRIGVGLNATILLFAAQNGLATPLAVHTATLKKWVTGSGRAEKPAMIAWAKEKLGRDPIDDNEADAVAVALWAMEHMKGNT